MSAAEALKAALAAGIQLGIDGQDLVLQAPAPPTPAVLDALSRHKAEIVSLLRPTEEGWSAEDRRAMSDAATAANTSAKEPYFDADGNFVHPCLTCGKRHANFGYGVSLREGRLGRWYCAEHRLS